MTYRIMDEFNETEMEEQSGGSFLITAAWSEDEWVYGKILSYGDSVEVLEPEHLREIIRLRAEKIIKKYL